MSIPATLKVISEQMAELRKDASVAGEAQAQVLHKLDQILALLRRRRGHGKVRDTARTDR